MADTEPMAPPAGDSGYPVPGTDLRICVFGLGEAGSRLATDLAAAGAEVTAYDPAEVPTPDGITRHVHPSLAVHPADVVLAATAGLDARLALLQSLDAVRPGTLYADVSTAAPGVKLAMANEAIERDIVFVDVALMSMVPGRGLGTPALAAGPGAAGLAERLNPLGADIEPIGGLPGAAAAKKLLRSVMMKGVAAVLVEAVRAGAAADDLEWLWANLATEIEGADEDWMRRLVIGSRTHARRRLDEMEAAVALLDGLDVEPVMTRATVASLADLLAGGDLPELPDLQEN